MKPLVHKFRTQKNLYIYDTNTNNIIKTNNVIFDIIESYKSLKISELIKRLEDKYSEEEILKAYNEIELFHKREGMFRCKPLEKMIFPYSTDEIKEYLETDLEQLILNVTEECNLDCSYCIYSGRYLHHRRHSKRRMSLDIAKKALSFFFDRCSKKNFIHIGFYGGEPLLAKNLILDCVNFTAKACSNLNNKPAFSITTNGILLDEKTIGFLIKNDFSLLVSLDGPKQINDRYRITRNGKGTFDLVANNLKSIRKINEHYYQNRVGFSVVLVPPYNLNSVFDFFSEYNEIVCGNRTVIRGISPEENCFFKTFLPAHDPKDYENQIGQLAEEFILLKLNEKEGPGKLKVLNNFIGSSLLKIHSRQKQALPEFIFTNGCCLPGKNRLFVTTEGKFYPCEKIGESIVIGDIWSGFNHESIFSLIKEYIGLSEQNCIICWAVRLCTDCFASCSKGAALDKDMKKKNCLATRSHLDLLLRIYSEIMEKQPNAHFSV